MEVARIKKTTERRKTVGGVKSKKENKETYNKHENRRARAIMGAAIIKQPKTKGD